MRKRQNAVKELTSKHALLFRFLHTSKRYQASRNKRQTLIQWLKSKSMQDSMQVEFYLSVILILIFGGTLVAIIFKFIPPVSFLAVSFANLMMTASTFAKQILFLTKQRVLNPLLKACNTE